MKNNLVERYGTAAFVIGSIIGTYFFSRPKKRGARTKLSRKQQHKIDQNLMTPANATFGVVWPVLYAGAIGLAIHQAMPSEQFNPRYTKARPWLLACYALNGIFGYFFSKSSKRHRIGAALTTVSMVGPALFLHNRLEIGSNKVSEPENTIRKTIGMYAGWLTAAAAISVTTLIQEAGQLVDNESARRAALCILPITAGTGLFVSKKLNDPYYLITIIAALIGISVKQKDEHNDVSRLAATLAMSLIVSFISRMDETQILKETYSSLNKL